MTERDRSLRPADSQPFHLGSPVAVPTLVIIPQHNPHKLQNEVRLQM